MRHQDYLPGRHGTVRDLLQKAPFEANNLLRESCKNALAQEPGAAKPLKRAASWRGVGEVAAMELTVALGDWLAGLSDREFTALSNGISRDAEPA